MSSSSSVDRRAVDCKASPAGSFFGSAHDVILFLAWGKATAEPGPRLSFSSQVQEWIDSNKHFLEGDIERFSLDCRIGIGFGFGFGFTTSFGWLVYLLWFWFYDSQVKTALYMKIHKHVITCQVQPQEFI